jgi:REP element-mobilizing transposase RayT
MPPRTPGFGGRGGGKPGTSVPGRHTSLIHESRRDGTLAHFVGIGKNRNIPTLAAGGMANHAHILFALPSDVSIAKAVQTFKANSSRWLGEHGIGFAWQEGYGAFSVSPSNVDAVKHYIRHTNPNIMGSVRSKMNSSPCCGNPA